MPDLHHPAVESFILPLLLGVVTVGVGRLVNRQARLDALAIGITLIICSVVIIDRPLWPPRSALEKLPFAVTGYVLIGLGLALNPTRSQPVTSLATACLIFTIPWFAWTQLQRPETLWLVIGLVVIGIVLLLRVSTVPASRPGSAIMLSAAAFGLAGTAIVSGSMLLGEISMALGSATLGAMLWPRGATSPPRDVTLIFGGVMPFLTVAALCLLLTDAAPVAIAALVGVFYVSGPSTRVGCVTPGTPSNLVLILRVLVIVGASLGLALMIGSGADLDYR